MLPGGNAPVSNAGAAVDVEPMVTPLATVTYQVPAIPPFDCPLETKWFHRLKLLVLLEIVTTVGEQPWLTKLPSSAPLAPQVRVCPTAVQSCPGGTLVAEYAVTLWP